MPTANVHQAKTNLSKLIDAALRGEDVVIARDGVPAVRLIPFEAKRVDRTGGWLRGRAKILDSDWDKPDPEVEKLFYESVLFPENERALPSAQTNKDITRSSDDAT